MTTITTTMVDPRWITPPHEAHDEAKLDTLIESMRADGWQGAPVVAIPGQDDCWTAITGSHRLAAATTAGIDVPVVNVDDLLSTVGTSLAELDDMYGQFDQDFGGHGQALRYLPDHLPAETVDHYGLDLH